MITVDDREVLQHPDIEEKLQDVPITVVRLDSADYAFLDRNNDAVGIERCEVSNFIQKIRNGELEAQLSRCAEQYKTVVLAIEGVFDNFGGLVALYRKGNSSYYRNTILPATRYDAVIALLCRLNELGIEIIQTANFADTMRMVRTLYQQRTKPEEAHTFFVRARVVRIPPKLTTNEAVPRLMALCPRMAERTAIRLIQQYGSIWAVLNADPKEVIKVEGMGKTLYNRLLTNVGLV